MKMRLKILVSFTTFIFVLNSHGQQPSHAPGKNSGHGEDLGAGWGFADPNAPEVGGFKMPSDEEMLFRRMTYLQEQRESENLARTKKSNSEFC